jgi:hypothetical protein
MTEALTLYKLIILYMLNKVNFPLTNAQFSSFLLEKEYTTYFTLQQAISELIDSDLIKVSTIRNSSHYSITENGLHTLTFFQKKISVPIRQEIDDFLFHNKYELRNEVSVIADYLKNTNQEYVVQCRVKEKYSDVINITLTVPDKAQAIAMCKNWEKKNHLIYDFIMTELM